MSVLFLWELSKLLLYIRYLTLPEAEEVLPVYLTFSDFSHLDMKNLQSATPC